MASSISAIAIHFKGNMLRDLALFQCSDQKLSKLVGGPFSWRRLQNEFPKQSNSAGHVDDRRWAVEEVKELSETRGRGGKGSIAEDVMIN